jgi:hypothetical protein
MPEPRDNADSALRDYFTAMYVDLRAMFSRTLPDDRTADGRSVWQIWTPIVDALLGGEAVTVHRYELPAAHPQAPPHGGDPGDLLTLGADDVLRPFDRSASAARGPAPG